MNCDRIAPFYGMLEYMAFGNLLANCRGQFIPNIKGARRVLVLGDGDGRALMTLLKTCREASVDYIDLSARMLRLAERRVTKAGLGSRVRFLQGDALTVAWPGCEYDAVITHFFLDCLDEPSVERLAKRLAQASKANSVWIISEFQDSRPWSRALVRMLYFLFKISTGLQISKLASYREILDRNGFRNSAREFHGSGLLVSEQWLHRNEGV